MSDGPLPIKRRRLAPKDRERMILDEAVDFFAEAGFEGQTRLLAERLGITQPLLYRYFANKDRLIARALERAFERRWEQDWAIIFTERHRPLEDRLIDFYRLYWCNLEGKDYLRLLAFAGLRGDPFLARHFRAVKLRIIEPICHELRLELGLPDACDLPTDVREEELAETFHGAISNIALWCPMSSQVSPAGVEHRIVSAIHDLWPICRDGVQELFGAAPEGPGKTRS